MNACEDYMIIAVENMSKESTKQPMMLSCAVSKSLQLPLPIPPTLPMAHTVDPPTPHKATRTSTPHHHATCDVSTGKQKNSLDSSSPPPEIAMPSAVLIMLVEVVSKMKAALLRKARFPLRLSL